MSVSSPHLFYFRENKPKNGGICVANHTTPIDIIILANDGCYSMVEKFVSVRLVSIRMNIGEKYLRFFFVRAELVWNSSVRSARCTEG